MFFGQTCLNPQIVRQRRENSTRKQSYTFWFMAVLYLETYQNISFICSTQIKIHPTPSPRLCDVRNLLLLEVDGFLWVYWHEFWLSVALRCHFSCRRSEMFKSKDVWNKRTMKHSYYSPVSLILKHPIVSQTASYVHKNKMLLAARSATA